MDSAVVYNNAVLSLRIRVSFSTSGLGTTHTFFTQHVILNQIDNKVIKLKYLLYKLITYNL